MAKLSHNLEYLAARLGMSVACLLSSKTADRFGAGLGSLSHLLVKSRRRVASDNLRQALGNHLGEAEIDAIVKRVFQNVGRALIETARFGRMTPELMQEIIVGDGEQHIRQARENGRGAVFLTAHFGNWELLGGWAGTHGMPIDLLTGEQSNQLIDAMMNNQRQKLGVGIIPKKTSLRVVFKTLKANRMVGIAADQHDPSNSLILEFFGRLASVPRGPAAFAVKAGCPILPALMRRERYDRHVVMAGEPIFPPDSGDVEADIRNMTIQYLKFYEEIIGRYPDQWMWTHRRWKYKAESTQLSALI